MWLDKASVKKLNIENRRIIVISDIHANLPYFKALLDKVGFCDDDLLILDGDFLEKGEDSLGTLRYIMKLAEKGNVHAICGNCDSWAEIIDGETYFVPPKLLKYMLFRRGGICWDMFREMGLEISEGMDLESYMPQLAEQFKAEWDFLGGIPQIIETPHYTFVHGGIKPDIPPEEQMAGDCMKFDNFMGNGYTFDKWVIVGHWPVMLYLDDHVCANPIIDREHRIISIDGGCVLKDDGQLNALIIPYEGSDDFSFVAYDPFPVKKVSTYQAKGEKSYYIRWGDNEVEVLERGEEFSRCRHIRTGYEMDILTKYLYSDEKICTVNDSTDLILELSPGDEVSVIEETSRGCLVKHKGTSGWYFGELV